MESDIVNTLDCNKFLLNIKEWGEGRVNQGNVISDLHLKLKINCHGFNQYKPEIIKGNPEYLPTSIESKLSWFQNININKFRKIECN